MSSMYDIPKTPQEIRERIRRYERKLRKEKEESGMIHDGAGKRYFLGPLYLLLDDLDGALESFRWFEKEFPDDGGEPGHRLSWALALYRSGDYEAAKQKLREAMLTNLYVIPRLLDQEVEEIDMWHGSNDEEPWYLDDMPPDFFSLWDEDALRWAARLYHGEEFQAVATRYIEIHRRLLDLPRGAERSRLVNEVWALRRPHA